MMDHVTDQVTDQGFNRTFMELKYRRFSFSSKETKVLIVPLWN